MKSAHTPFVAFLCWLLLVMACANTDRSRSKGPEINPEVRLTSAGVSVRNKDRFAYDSMELTINMTHSGAGPTAHVSGIKPGQSVTVPYGEFLEDGARRFKVSEVKILTVVVAAKVEGRESFAVMLFPDPSAPGVRGPEKE